MKLGYVKRAVLFVTCVDISQDLIKNCSKFVKRI